MDRQRKGIGVGVYGIGISGFRAGHGGIGVKAVRRRARGGGVDFYFRDILLSDAVGGAVASLQLKRLQKGKSRYFCGEIGLFRHVLPIGMSSVAVGHCGYGGYAGGAESLDSVQGYVTCVVEHTYMPAVGNLAGKAYVSQGQPVHMLCEKAVGR